MNEIKRVLNREPHKHHEFTVRNLPNVRAGSRRFAHKFIVLFIFLYITVPVFAQPVNPPWWLSLEYGKQRFRSGDYGSALMLFEDARRDRRSMYEQMERDIITLLSTAEARRIGDSLERIERFANDRNFTASIAALNELYYRVPKSSLNNSANAALAAMGKLKNFPEAEYWIGEVYRVEGELSLALSQYRRALSMSDNLEDPNFAAALLYKISGILGTRQEYNEMERTLFMIINSMDALWTNASRTESGISSAVVSYEQASAAFTRAAMTRTLENEGINRFLELYRYNNVKVEQAHRLLGFYYADTGRPSAQHHLMFAFLIQNTVIIEELRRRQFDFTFTDLSSLAQEINRNSLLLSFIDEVEYYKTAYYFGASLFRNGRTETAVSVWEFLAAQMRAGEWQGRAASQLRSPRLEPIVEMP